MKTEELEKSLNEEYKNIGSISISKMHYETIDSYKIEYIGDIFNNVQPLDIDKPIIVSSGFKLIDGYHRLKHHTLCGEKKIPVIVLDSYKISRRNDTLFDFLSRLIGKNISFIDGCLLSVDGVLHGIIANEGCGGCNSGWSSIEVLPEFIGKSINVKSVKSVDDDDNEDVYSLLINDTKVATVDTGWGNGYYGGDFEIELAE